MSNFKRRGGFKAFEKEEERKEQERTTGRNLIYGLFLKEGQHDVPIRFLTSEPILGHFHSVPKAGGRGMDDIPCKGTGCELCAEGEYRASLAGGWLVLDLTPWERKVRKDGKETGEVEEVSHSVRILKRGSKDIAVYNQKNSKFSLTDYSWELSRLGKESSTTYSIERMENEPLSVEEQMEYLELLPRGLFKYLEEKVEEHGGVDEIEPEDFEDVLMDLVEFSMYKDTEEVVESLERSEAEYEANRKKEQSEPKAKKFGSRSKTTAPASTGKKSFRSKARASGIVRDEEEDEAPKKRPLAKKRPLKKR